MKFVDTGAIRRLFATILFFVSATQFLRDPMLGNRNSAFMEKMSADVTSHATRNPTTVGYSGIDDVSVHVRP